MLPRDLFFAAPYFSILLLAIPVFAFLFWSLHHFRKKSLAPFLGNSSLNPLVHTRSKTLFWTKVSLLCLAWIFATLALMQPEGNGRYPKETAPKQKQATPPGQAKILRKAHEIHFLLDVSASMSVKDTRIGSSRLNYAKEMINSIMEQLTGETVSLYTFTSDVATIVPPTLDYFYLLMMLRQIKINEGDSTGTDLKEALTFMHNEVLAKESREMLKTLIILSDGEDNQFQELKGEERETWLKSIVKNVDDAAELNLRVYTIGMGSKTGGNIPDLTFQGQPVHSSLVDVILKALSTEGRGKYYVANDYTPLLLAMDLIKQMQQDNPYVETTVNAQARTQQENLIYDLFFQFPLALALICLCLGIFLPDTLAEKPRFAKENAT